MVMMSVSKKAPEVILLEKIEEKGAIHNPQNRRFVGTEFQNPKNFVWPRDHVSESESGRTPRGGVGLWDFGKRGCLHRRRFYLYATYSSGMGKEENAGLRPSKGMKITKFI